MLGASWAPSFSHCAAAARLGSDAHATSALPSDLVALPLDLVAWPSKFAALPAGLVAVPSKLFALPSGLVALPSNLVALPSNLVALPSHLVGVSGSDVQALPLDWYWAFAVSEVLPACLLQLYSNPEP